MDGSVKAFLPLKKSLLEIRAFLLLDKHNLSNWDKSGRQAAN
jgi:hypothetical protein